MIATVLVRFIQPDVLEWLAVQPNPQQPDTLPQQGSVAEFTHATRGKTCVFIYPGEQVHTLRLQAPQRRRSEWLQALPYALEEQLADDIDALTFKHGKTDSQQHVPVAIYQQASFASAMQTLLQHGIRPQHSSADFLLLPLHTDNETNGNETNGHAVEYCLACDQQRVWVRYGNHAGFVCDANNAALMLEKLLAEAAETALPRSLRLLLLPDSESVSKAITALLQQRYPAIKVVTETRASLLDCLQWPQPQVLNLAQHRPQKSPLRVWRAAAVLAGLIVSIALLKDGLHWYQLNAEKRELNQQIQQVFRTVLPNARLVNPRAQLANLLGQQPTSSTAQNVLLPLLGICAEALQNFPTLTLRSLSFRQKNLQIEVTGGNLELLDSLQRQLAKQRDITVQLRSSVRDGQVLGRFSLRFSSNAAGGAV